MAHGSDGTRMMDMLSGVHTQDFVTVYTNIECEHQPCAWKPAGRFLGILGA